MSVTGHKEVQVLISFANDKERNTNEAFEMTADDLRALTRHLSSIRISDVENRAVLPMKNLHDGCLAVCTWIKNHGG